ncbi:MAG: host-nuclease inhibitor Gam family protein [Candidatus Aminicenantes bacterium]|nr:host-nuclease inhibitor Gam family protein [Candidatus Aminicenantes bacterium]
MARLKPDVGKIKNLEDANMALKTIGLLERELAQIDGEADKAISKIKEEAVKKGGPVRKQIEALSASIGAFAQYNREDLFSNKKTIELSFGSFGFRKSTSIRIKKTTIGLLKKLKLMDYIRIKEEPDKEAMAKLTDENLAKVDASRKVKDDFFCEADKEEINKDLLQKQVISA